MSALPAELSAPAGHDEAGRKRIVALEAAGDSLVTSRPADVRWLLCDRGTGRCGLARRRVRDRAGRRACAGGAKSEDTVLVSNAGLEVTTGTPDLGESATSGVPRPAIVRP